MSSSVRAQVAAKLAPYWPDGWDVEAHTVKTAPTIARVTAYIEHTGYTALSAAPVGHVESTVTVTVLSPLNDWEKAEEQLDVPVLAFITDLDGDTELRFDRANKTTVKDTYLGWAIELAVITAKETST